MSFNPAVIAMRNATAIKFERFIASVVNDAALIAQMPGDKGYRPRLDKIAHRLCRVFNVSLMEVRSPRRDSEVSMARQAIYYWAWRVTELSSSQIGRRMGNRDHTTVLYGVKVYRRKRAAMGRNLRELRRAAQ